MSAFLLGVFRRVAGGSLAPMALVVMTAGTGAAQEIRDQYHTAPRDTVSPQVYSGWKQFEINCSRCHGEFAVGTSFAPALIQSVKPDGGVPTKEAFIQTVCAGRPEKGMPAWCAVGLEFDKIENMYLYIKGRSEGKIGTGRPAVREDS